MRRKTPLVVTFILFFLTFSGLTERVFADASAQLKQAGAYQNNRQYEQAEAIYQQIITAFPDTNDALEAQEQLVLIYIADGTQQQADAAFEKLLADFSEHKGIAAAVWWIAKRYNTSKKYEKALQLNQYNVEHFPKDIHAMWSQMNIIRSYTSDGNEPAADAAFKKLLAVFSDQPTLPEEVWRIAKMYSELKRNDKAFKLYQYDVEHFPKDIHAMWSQMEIVKSYIRDANEPSADAAFNKLLTVFSDQPTLPEEVWWVAKMYSELKRNDKAFELNQYNVEHFPKDIHAMWSQMNIIRAYIRDANEPAADAAVKKLLTVFADQPTLPTEIYQLATAYNNAGMFDKAEQIHQYVINNKAEHTILAETSMARSNIALGNDAAAQADVNSLIADFNDNPDLPEAIFTIGEDYYNKAMADVNAGRTNQADANFVKTVSIWDRIIIQMPDSNSTATAHIYYFSAGCYRKLGKYEKAVEYFQKVVDKWPDYQYAWSAQFLIGECYEKLQRSGKLSVSEAGPLIEQAYQAVIEKYPDCSLVGHACLKLSDMYLQKGNRDKAAACLELFLKTAGPADPRIINTIKVRLERLGGQTK